MKRVEFELSETRLLLVGTDVFTVIHEMLINTKFTNKVDAIN